MQHVATVFGLEHYVVKLLYGLQRTLILHVILVLVLRLLAKRTCRGHETLSAYGIKHILWLQSVLSHHVWFHPYTQSVGITQCEHLAHTSDTLKARCHVDVHIVRYEVVAVFSVCTPHGKDAQNVVLTLLHRDT